MAAYIKSYINTGHDAEPARNFPVYLPSNISIITGYYEEDFELVDVSTDVTITVMDSPASNSYKVDPANINYFYLFQAGGYTFEVVFTDILLSITYTDYISLVVINPVKMPSELDVYNLIKRSEPQGVYTQLQTSLDTEGNTISANDYVDVTASSTVFSNLYADIKTVYDNLLPSGGSINWELTLNNTSGILSNQPYSDIILSMLYSLLVNNSGNKYDVSYFLSKYIWYRSDKTIPCYVYIKEVTPTNYLFWILGTSLLGTTTFLNESSFTPYQVEVYFIPQAAVIPDSLKLELTNLVPRILPYGYTYLTFFDETLADLGLTEYIPQTYKSDPRLGDFAIQFISTNVNQAQAYINPLGPQSIVSLAMFPVSGTNFIRGGYYSYTVIATYLNGSTQDVTGSATIFSSDTDVLVLSDIGTLYAVGDGSANLRFSYDLKYGVNNYTVSSATTWILDTSALDLTTILS